MRYLGTPYTKLNANQNRILKTILAMNIGLNTKVVKYGMFTPKTVILLCLRVRLKQALGQDVKQYIMLGYILHIEIDKP